MNLGEVMRRLPLRELIRAVGDEPSSGKWKSWPKCPFCGNKDCAGVFTAKGADAAELFKCHHTDCGGIGALNAVGYLAARRGLSTQKPSGGGASPAWEAYCKLAGVWEEPHGSGPVSSVKLPAAEAGGDEPLSEPEAEPERPPEPEEFTEGNEGNEEPREASAPATDKESLTVPTDEDSRTESSPVEDAAAAEAVEAPGVGERARAALQEFWAAMPWTEGHAEECLRKRGLTAATCAAAGLRSSVRGNRALLEALADKYERSVLLDAGLWVRTPAGEFKPNPKLHGWGVTGKVVGARKGEDDLERGMEGDALCACGVRRGKCTLGHTEFKVYGGPVVIPYFDEHGVCALRPHKDFMAGDMVRLYEPPRARPAEAATPEVRPLWGMLTEGEFKALAFGQELGGDVAVAALPGISQSKPLQAEIEDWLESRLGPRATVVVAFDNEEKGDPKLPGFKPEKWKRFDAEVWARYLARVICRASCDGRVGRLPDEWRNAAGKADWDGALAKLGPGKAAKAFWKVLRSAPGEAALGQAGLFDAEDERIIRNKLERLDYTPQLPAGGSAEAGLVRRLRRFVAKVKDDRRVPDLARRELALLGRKYAECAGRYYVLRKPDKDELKYWAHEAQAAQQNCFDEYLRLVRLRLQGLPNPISNFTVTWHYLLERSGGHCERLLTVRNVYGEEQQCCLPSDDFGSSVDWQKWLLKLGNFSWGTGERERQALHADAARHLAYKRVRELVTFGEDHESHIWFFLDGAITPEGEVVTPDERGIFWIRRKDYTQGYTFRRDNRGHPLDREGQWFVQGHPKMRPETLRPAAQEFAEVSALWCELAQAMERTVGGWDGWVPLGMMASYAAMRELYGNWSCSPGLWMHGEQSQGKSSVARWMIRLWGFETPTGKPLKGSTAAKTRASFCQYSNLPVWLEEYQPNCPEWQQELIKNIFDRSPGMKIDAADAGPREMLTSVIVTGVATSYDGQVKSRYAHVQVSARRRKAPTYEWFQGTGGRSLEFYRIGRALLLRRKEFVKAFTAALAKWSEDPELTGVDDRARMVHGVAYAGFAAADQVLGGMGAASVESYRKFLILYCREAVAEVSEQVNVNQFFLDLLSAVQAPDCPFGQTPAEMREFFLWEATAATNPPDAPSQTVQCRYGRPAWESVRLYLPLRLVVEQMKVWKRQRGMDVQLHFHDLRKQMEVKGYWVPKLKAGAVDPEGWMKCFAGRRQAKRCVCIDLDKFPDLGYRPVSDTELNAALFTPEGVLRHESDRVDPRLGDLYMLGELLTGREKEEG